MIPQPSLKKLNAPSDKYTFSKEMLFFGFTRSGLFVSPTMSHFRTRDMTSGNMIQQNLLNLQNPGTHIYATGATLIVWSLRKILGYSCNSNDFEAPGNQEHGLLIILGMNFLLGRVGLPCYSECGCRVI